MSVSRREFLRAAGLAAGGLILAACAEAEKQTEEYRPAPTSPAASPFAQGSGGTQSEGRATGADETVEVPRVNAPGIRQTPAMNDPEIVDTPKMETPAMEAVATPERLRPERVLGIYLPYEKIWKPEVVRERLDWLSQSGGNTIVVDIKSEQGRTVVPFDHPLRTEGDYMDNPENLLRLMEMADARGIHVVARQVVMIDNRLAERYPAAVLQTRNGPVYHLRKFVWLNPLHPMVAEYNAAVAEGVKNMGVKELQLDYIRWPYDVSASYDLTGRVEPIGQVLAAVREVLNGQTLLTADFLGWSASGSNQSIYDGGVGQSAELLGLLLDGLCPMFYPDITNQEISTDPYQYILEKTRVAAERLRLGNPEAFINPWVQSFYTLQEEAEVEAQLRGAMDAGAVGAYVWNPRSDYSPGIFT